MKQGSELRHRVTVRSGRTGLGLTSADRTTIRHAVYATLSGQKVNRPCEVSVLITDDAGIRQLNRDFREQDKPTDVLSFPTFDLIPGEELSQPQEVLPDGLFPLGDIAISLPRAQKQADEYGHALQRELGFLTVHGSLHLLGYDHMDEDSERDMRTRAEAVLAELGLNREGPDDA